MEGLAASDNGLLYQSIMAHPFQKSLDLLKPPSTRKAVYDCLRTLARGKWGTVQINHVTDSVMALNVTSNLAVVFEILEARPRNILCYYDICSPERVKEVSEKIMQAKAESKSPLPRRTAAFSKIIPDWALDSQSNLEEIMNLDKAGLLLTKEQEGILHVQAPLIINGAAGSGKTLLLCYRLANVIHNPDARRNRLVFLSYNWRLVEKARQDTGEILRGLYHSLEGLEAVNFSPMRVFFLGYVKNPDRYKQESYVGFGRFKEYYTSFSRGNAALRTISSEKAWHGIRSILKGACLPPSAPPLSKLDYERLARKRKDFSQHEFDNIYMIGVWYQKELIIGKGLWDDQDLAWDALNSIIADKTFSSNFVLYDRIFCDEAQDLTQLEFRTLMELCKPPSGPHGFQITMAGDPLQTINPTGFKWSVVRNEIYRVLHGSSVQFSELGENFRSDKRIVDFANEIQEIRGVYMDQAMTPQEAFVENGETPQVITLVSDNEEETARTKLGELPPESAIIVWPEERAEVTRFCDAEKALAKIDRQLDLYTISEAKGLEFRLVILYKLGSSDEAGRLRKYLGLKQLQEQERPSFKDEIALLYFLNRMYVAITRAKLYLIIIDTQEGLDRFWSLWKDFLEIIPRDQTRTVIEGSPAFQGEFSDVKWRKWGQTLLDHAEDTLDIRSFERAKRAFEKSGEESKVKSIAARLEELRDNNERAGYLYYEINDFARSASCFERSKNWNEACRALERMPTTREVNRRLATCRFRRDIVTNKEKAAQEFYSYFVHDRGLERDPLEELASILVQTNPRASGDVFGYIGIQFNDKSSLAKAAQIKFIDGEFVDAVDLYEKSGATSSREYDLSRAEKLNLEKDYAGAIKIFYAMGNHKRVVEIYEQAIEAKWSPGDVRLDIANSYTALGQTDAAMLIYEDLSIDLAKRGLWKRALDSIGPEVFYRDRRIEGYCRIISIAVKSKTDFTEEDKDRLIDAARFVVSNPYWDFRIKPEEMGVIYSQCGTVTEKVDFYRQFLNEPWTHSAYLTALEELMKFHQENGDQARADLVESEIKRFKKEKGLR
jgi:tetratricopeptide (TPR) repeat protein